MTLAIALICAYVISYPAFALTYYELRRYPRHMWTGYGQRHPWREATVVSYLAGGLPVFVVALAWRSSTTRRELRNLAARTRIDR